MIELSYDIYFAQKLSVGGLLSVYRCNLEDINLYKFLLECHQ